MRTKEEMLIMLDEIFGEIGKLEQEILSNQKKGIKIRVISICNL
jgi:hypothetical protein